MSDQIVLSEGALGYLKATKPWVTFLAILGFVFAALMVLVGLVMAAAFTFMPAKPGVPGVLGPWLGIAYILLAVFFYIIPCLYLLRYGAAIANIVSQGQQAFEEALRQQKSFWKYMGIFAIVMIVLYIVLLIGMFGFIGHMAAHAPAAPG